MHSHLSKTFNLPTLLKDSKIVHPSLTHDDRESKRYSNHPFHRVIAASVADVYVSVVIHICFLMYYTEY